MTAVDPARLQELAALSAAGAATEDEQQELDRMVAADPEARDEVRAFADAASLLAFELGAAAPPPLALDRIRAELDRPVAVASPPAAAPGEPSAAAPGRDADIISLLDRKKNRAIAISAAALAAAAAFAFLWLRERGAAADLRDEMAAELGRADLEKRELRDIMTEEIAKARNEAQQQMLRFAPVTAEDVKLTTVAADGGAVLKIFVDGNQRRWLVFAHELPPAPPDKDYQLWFVPKGGKPVSAGLLEAGPEGRLIANPQVPQDLGPVAPAVSLEPKGGSAQPTDIKLVGGELI